MDKTSLIQCEQLVVNGDEDGETNAKLDLTANAGNVISIIGPDHDSKSNWLQTLGGIIEAKSGRLYLAGKEVMQFEKKDWAHIRTQFAYIHANTEILSAINALQNMMLPAVYHKTGEASEIRIKAQQLLKDIDAGNNLELLPAYLNKEQRYKIAVARALILKPKALLLDNPFLVLDQSSVHQFKQFLLGKVREDNLLLILVTHDIKFALKYSDQIIFISKHHMHLFDQTQRIHDSDDPEVCKYLAE